MTTLAELHANLAKAEAYRKFNRIRFWEPYPKQVEFANMSADCNEATLFAGNQLGKTWVGAAIMAMHLTGEYQDWYTGRRFETPINAWTTGPSVLHVRDGPQSLLLGAWDDPSAEGSGFIPKANIAETVTNRGTSGNVIESASIRHKSGGMSRLNFKTYKQEREDWQGATLHVVWLDEEPPEALYTEALARTTVNRGYVYMTFTPLKGFSVVVKRYLDTPTEKRRHMTMAMSDAAHCTAEVIQEQRDKYPQREWPMRIDGVPKIGAGMVFTRAIDELLWHGNVNQLGGGAQFIWGIDFGGSGTTSHPFAAVLCAFVRSETFDKVHGDCDQFIVLGGFRMTGQSAPSEASAMLKMGANVPVAWPHDGHAREKGSGEPLQKLYRDEGLKMLAEHATAPQGGYHLEGSIGEIDTWMIQGRFLIAAGFADLLSELARYHRDDKGEVVKTEDDLISAMRYAFMMRRYARVVPLGGTVVKLNRPTGQTLNPFTGQATQRYKK